MQLTPPASRSKPAARAGSRAAPMKGLNVADPLTGTPDGHAVRLENWIVRRDGLHIRDGHTTVFRCGAGPVTSLMSMGRRLFAATPQHVYAEGAPVASLGALEGGVWSSSVIMSGAGRFLVGSNGADGHHCTRERRD